MDTRTVSLDMLLGNVGKGITGLYHCNWPCFEQEVVLEISEVPSKLDFVMILWSSLGCEEESAWASHGLLDGERKKVCPWTRSSWIYPFWSWQQGESASLWDQSSRPQQKWGPAPRHFWHPERRAKGLCSALTATASCWFGKQGRRTGPVVWGCREQNVLF